MGSASTTSSSCAPRCDNSVPAADAGESPRYPRAVARRTGRKLLQFDRKLGARFVAGADEAGRGPLAGPLLVAGVLLDYGRLRDHRVRPLACLNDSKQCSEAEREELFRAVVGCAERIVVRAVPPRQIDSDGLHRSNLA